MSDETVRPALTELQWADLNGPCLFYGVERSTGGCFVYLDGEGIGISLAVTAETSYPSDAPAPIEIPEGDRHGLAALALHGKPFGFTREDVTLLATVVTAVGGIASVADPLRSLAERIAALLPPEGA